MGRVPAWLWVGWSACGAVTVLGADRLEDARVVGFLVAAVVVVALGLALVLAFFRVFDGFGVVARRWVDERLARP